MEEKVRTERSRRLQHGGNQRAANVVCVLGMHRSGTSVAAGVLRILGASLGPEDKLVSPRPDNPKGFSEHRPIVALNNALLARLGGRPFAPPGLPPGWESSPLLDDLRERGEEIARELFVGRDVTVWKDPRVCLTLAFWQQVMPPMRYVICVRHPADVAASLHRRNRVRFETSCYLWLLYTRHALSGTVSHSRCVVVYDRLMEKPAHEVAMLGSFLGTDARADQHDVKLALDTFLDAGLRHHRHTLSDTWLADRPAASRRAFQLAQQAYELLADTKPLDQASVDHILSSGLSAMPRDFIPRPSPQYGEPHGKQAATDETS